MPEYEKIHFFNRILNFKVIAQYVLESIDIIKQGARFKDKLILTIYYLKIPIIVIKSLFTNRHFRELERRSKYLLGNVILKNKYGIYYCGNNILTVYTVNANSEKYIYPYIDLKSGIFIDVGAHIGKYSIKVGMNPNVKVIALEPEQYNFTLLEKNIVLNKLKNIICINKGAFSTQGGIPFYLADVGDGTHSVYRQSDRSKPGLIDVDTLDNIIINQLNLNGGINLIKIDVEGAEVEVLKGAKRVIAKNRPALMIEIWEKNVNNLKSITSFLQPFGYMVVQLDNDNYYFF